MDSRWKQAINRFGERSSIHSVSEVFSENLGGKAFWVIVLAIHTFVMCQQVSDIVRTWMDEDVGTTTTVTKPLFFPSVYICRTDWIDGANHLNITPNMFRVLSGYLPIADVDLAITNMGAMLGGRGNYNYVKEYKVIEEMLAKHNWSLSKLVKSLAGPSVSPDRLILPLMLPLAEKIAVNWAGVCGLLQTNVTAGKLDTTFSSTFLKVVSSRVTQPGSSREPDYQGVLERASTFILAVGKPGVLDMLFDHSALLHFGFQYTAAVTVIETNRRNRKAYPCRESWSAGDHMHCTASYLNKHTCKALAGCTTYLPATDNFPEVSSEHMCNGAYHGTANTCLSKALASEAKGGWTMGKCPQPCSEVMFHFTFQNSGRVPDSPKSEVAWLEVRVASGLKMVEYLKVSDSGMVSGVGGLTGLWLGASIMSLTQMLYYFVLEVLINRPRNAEKKTG